MPRPIAPAEALTGSGVFRAAVRCEKKATWKSPLPSHQFQRILDVPTFFRPGGLQFRRFIASLITPRQFSLDQTYFILLGQRYPAVGVRGHTIPCLALRHHVIQIDPAVL